MLFKSCWDSYLSNIIFSVLFSLLLLLFLFCFFLLFIIYYLFLYIFNILNKTKRKKGGGGMCSLLVGFCQVHEDLCDFFFFFERKDFCELIRAYSTA